MILPRMRTINETIKHLRENDPDCALTPWALRAMVKNGRIPSNKIGKKHLINIDLLDQYLQNDAASYSDPEQHEKIQHQALKLLG